MRGWWIYEFPNAQVAFDAVLAVEARCTPDEITGLAIISRDGPDDRDHLYLCAASKNPPNGRIDGVEEFLDGFGRRCPFTIDDVNGPSINFLASGPAESILTLLLLQYPRRPRDPLAGRHSAHLLGRVRDTSGAVREAEPFYP